MAMAFESTPLWQRTLAARPRDPHGEQREHLRTSFLDLRSNAAVLLNELAQSVPHYTVHDISHVDALWETASLIAGDQTTIDPAEAYVLGCAFVLHDAAMGQAAYRDDIVDVVGPEQWQDMASIVFVEQTGRWPDRDELDDLPAEVLATCRSEAIRQTHAVQAAKLVDQPWPTSTGNDMFLLPDVQLREAYGPLIGNLAASHWADVDVLPERFKHPTGSLPWQPVDWTIEPLKLACLLRLADACQLDSRRAPTFLFALRQPTGTSRDHWRFQEHLSRPRLSDDHISYTCLRPFEAHDAPSWWMALDYLRKVDDELQRVDSLLHDLRMPRFAVRAIACVDTPQRFAELFPVRGWQPVDIDPHISDVRALITALGGEQLYGRAPEVAVRELIQNAQDAVEARRAIDPDFLDGQVTVSLSHVAGEWHLEVRDNGVGMDEDIIADALLDFGRPGWQSSVVRKRFQGLTAGGFTPRGRFGVGFFSVFMIGDDVTVTTRRFDGGRADARRLCFHGLEARPLLETVAANEPAPLGTSVRVLLTTDPVTREGILHPVQSDTLAELVQWLLPESSVPVVTREWNDGKQTTLSPFDLDAAPPDEIFERLYPPLETGGALSRTAHRELQADFARRATEIVGDGGERLGLAVLGYDFAYWSRRNMYGVMTVNGFRANAHPFFAGYAKGKPNRASRDNVPFAASPKELRQWMQPQVARARELGLFGPGRQLELAYLLARTLGDLPDDHHIAMASQGTLQMGDLATWAADRVEIVWASGWPLRWDTRPSRIYHPEADDAALAVTLPPNWIVPCLMYWDPALDQAFDRRRDERYATARHHQTLTWQKEWWRLSDTLEGQMLRRVCESWGCEIGDILGPVAERDWSDHAELGGGFTTPVPVMHLRRP